MGSSRNRRSGLAGERARDREPLFLPSRKGADAAAPLALERDDLQQLTNLAAASVEGPKQAQHLFDGQLVAELCLLQMDAEPFPQLALARRPCESENLDVAPVRREEALEDLDRRRLAGAVRTEEPEALAAPDVQRQTGHGDDVTVAFLETVTLHCQVMHEVSLQDWISCQQTAFSCQFSRKDRLERAARARLNGLQWLRMKAEQLH